MLVKIHLAVISLDSECRFHSNTGKFHPRTEGIPLQHWGRGKSILHAKSNP